MTSITEVTSDVQTQTSVLLFQGHGYFRGHVRGVLISEVRVMSLFQGCQCSMLKAKRTHPKVILESERIQIALTANVNKTKQILQSLWCHHDD